MAKKIVISTLMGDTEFNPDDLVPVHVSEGRYVSKRAEEVARGDQVVYDREHAKVAYAEAESLFLTDEDINAAKRALFEEHDGKFSTRLRTFLARGARQKAADQSDVSRIFHKPRQTIVSGHRHLRRCTDEGLERKLFETGFNRPEVGFMRKLVKQTLDEAHKSKGTPTRARTQVGKWLDNNSGVVIAPSDWEIFGVLAQIHPEFRMFYADYKARAGITGREALAANRYHKYKFYVTLKQVIGQRIAIPGGPDLKYDGEDRDPEFSYLTSLIRNKAARFVRSVGKCHSSPVVLSVKRISHDGPAEPGLEKGVLSIDEVTEELELDMVNVNYYSDFNIVLSALTGVIYRYVTQHKEYGDLSYEAYKGLALSVEAFYSDVRHRIEHIRKERIRPVKGIPVDDQIRMVREVVQDVQDGKIDEALGFKGPYAFDLVSALNTIERAQPKLYQDYMNLNAEDTSKLNRRKAARIEKRLRSMERVLEQKYGYKIEGDMPEQERYSDYAPSLRHRYDPLQLASARQIPIVIHDGGVYIYDQHKISDCLRKFGLKDFTRFTDIRAYDGSCFR